MDYILNLKNVSKTYANFQLDSINMEIPYGRIVGLIGENGAGKTTLIHLILNQINRDHGNIQIFGLDNQKDEIQCKSRIGFVMDECCFHPSLSARNIDKIMCGVYTQWNEKQFFSLLSKLKINYSQKIEQMSKGTKIKLMLTVALSHEPELLLLDEVTSGLDPIVRDDVLMMLKDVVNDKHISILFSTHITSDLEKVADQVAFLHHGKLIFYKSLNELRNNYLLVKCSADEYQKINQNSIIASYYHDNVYQVLINNYKNDRNCDGKLSVPTLDDIMLIFIKGVYKK